MNTFENEDISVKTSPIHGLGVFANRNFKKGETIVSWRPTRIALSEIELAPTEIEKEYVNHKKDGTYFLMGIPERYVNHSCHSNSRVRGMSDVATRDIRKGEEITGDYEAEDWKDFICHCGAEDCKK